MRTDIFGLAPRQHDLFGAPQPAFDTIMDVDDIRAELTEALELLRAAETLPWTGKREMEVRTMFPEMAARLPDGEGEALVAAFNTEMRRLGRYD